MIRGILGGVIGGLVGAAIWALVGYFTGFEVGWIAWGVGVLVGMGVSIGAGEDTETLTGIFAALIALAAIAAGKFAVVHFHVNKAVDEVVVTVPAPTAEDAKIGFAVEIAEAMESEGKQLEWPAGKDLDTAESGADFPKSVWKESLARWSKLTTDEQSAKLNTMNEEMQSRIAMLRSTARTMAFRDSFSFWDALWCFLALSTAYKIGSGLGGDD